MQDDAKQIYANSSMDHLGSEQSRSNDLGNVPSKQDARLCQIQSSCYQPSGGNRHQSSILAESLIGSSSRHSCPPEWKLRKVKRQISVLRTEPPSTIPGRRR